MPQADDATELAILLPFCASFNRSQFAAQCFVEAVAQCYLAGVQVEDLVVRRPAHAPCTPAARAHRG